MKKKTVITIVLVLIAIMAICFGVYNFFLKPRVSLELKSDKVEASLSLKKKDIVTLNAPEDKEYSYKAVDSKNVKLNKVGKYTIKFLITDENDKEIRTQEFDIEVIDTTKPTINVDNPIEVVENEYESIEELYSVLDNTIDEVQSEVRGDYDLSKAGEYDINIVATDKSGNKSQKETKLIVSTKNESVSDESVTENDISGFDIGGYWVNEKKDMLILFKQDDGRGSVVVSKLSTGAGGGTGGEIKSTVKQGDEVTVTYRDSELNTTESFSYILKDSSTIVISSKYKSFKGTYKKWSESKVNQYWNR